VANHVVLSLFLAVAGAAATTFVLGLFKGPSIEDQLAEVRKDAATAGWTVRSFTQVRLRQAAPGYLFVLSPANPKAPSDRIRLYEARGNDLRLAFQYQPRLRRLGGSSTQYAADSVSFSILGTSDTDGDGQNELLVRMTTLWSAGGCGCPFPSFGLKHGRATFSTLF